MATLNLVSLTGNVVSRELESRLINKDKTDGKKSIPVLNFLIRCYDKEDGRHYTLPVAVWGKELVDQCMTHLKYGDLVYVGGVLRYKHVKDENGKIKEVYTSVKASTVEFISKKLKNEKLDYSMNEVKLIGNLVHNPVVGERGFVVAVDRLYPTKNITVSNDKLTDYVTLFVSDESKIKGNLKKGSVVIIDGKLMTRKKQEDKSIPRIVVGVNEIVGR